MTHKQKTVLKRGARSLAAVLVAAAAGWLAGPDAAKILGPQAETVVTGLLVPVLVMVDKHLRYGQDAGEDAGPDINV